MNRKEIYLWQDVVRLQESRWHWPSMLTQPACDSRHLDNDKSTHGMSSRSPCPRVQRRLGTSEAVGSAIMYVNGSGRGVEWQTALTRINVRQGAGDSIVFGIFSKRRLGWEITQAQTDVHRMPKLVVAETKSPLIWTWHR